MRCAATCLSLLLVGGIARAQAPALPTPAPPPDMASPAHETAPPPKVATKKKRRRPPPPPPPAAELFAVNTHETFKIRPDAKGRITLKQLHGWNRFLRCHHTGRVHSMSTRLAQLIYEVDKHFDFKRILVVAGYRAPRVAREKGNPKSPHKKGLACDFRIDGVANAELRDFVRNAFARVGVGYYPNSDFVHLDVRQKQSAFWIDLSGPGERARYAKDPNGVLRDETSIKEDEAEGPEPQVASEPGVVTPNAPSLNPTTP